MKILDDKSRLFGLVNPVDLVVIIAVIAALLLIASVLFPGVSPTKPVQSQVVRATFLAPGLRNFVPDSVKVGDPVNRKTGGRIGKVVSIKLKPSLLEVSTAAGELKTDASAVQSDVYLTVEGPGQINEGVSAFMGDEQLRSNQDIDIQTPTFEAVRTKVLGITKVR